MAIPGTIVDDRAQLLAIDGLGDRRAACMSDQSGDLLDRYAVVGQQRDEALAQFVWCPGGRIEAGCGGDAPEAAAHVGRIQLGTCSGGEHEVVVGPSLAGDGAGGSLVDLVLL